MSGEPTRASRRQLLQTVGGSALALGLAGCSGGGGGTSDGGGNIEGVHTPGSDDSHDWEEIAKREEDSSFDIPNSVPSNWGFKRAGDSMTISVPEFDTGTAYLVFSTDSGVSNVLVMESPYGGKDLEFDGDGPYSIDVAALTGLSIVWETEDGELYVVMTGDDILG